MYISTPTHTMYSLHALFSLSAVLVYANCRVRKVLAFHKTEEVEEKAVENRHKEEKSKKVERQRDGKKSG